MRIKTRNKESTVRDLGEGKPSAGSGQWIFDMRYSTIHHDIRQRFNLSLYEYVVADSIFQLSRSHPTVKSNREIGSFLGIDHKTVGKSKASLLEKGIILENDGAFTTTKLWDETVLWIKGGGEISPDWGMQSGEGIPKSGEGIPTYNYNKYNKKDFSKEKSFSEEEITEAPIDTDGDFVQTKQPKAKADPANDRIRREFAAKCLRELGYEPKDSIAAKTQIKRALGRISEEQCLDKIDEWFSRDMPDQHLMSILRCFSDNEINGYLVGYAK